MPRKIAVRDECKFEVVSQSNFELDEFPKLALVLHQFEVCVADSKTLSQLLDYSIIVLADDSGSMNKKDTNGSIEKRPYTRWQALQETLALLADFVGAMHPAEGLDVHFLNRQPVLGIRSGTDQHFLSCFEQLPVGSTPTTDALLHVRQALRRRYEADGQKQLLLIMSDGEPNGGVPRFTRTVEAILKKETHLAIHLMALTDHQESVEYLESVVENVELVHVTWDFEVEKRHALLTGRCKQFNRSDWLTKALLGSVVDKYGHEWESAKTDPYVIPKEQRLRHTKDLVLGFDLEFVVNALDLKHLGKEPLRRVISELIKLGKFFFGLVLCRRRLQSDAAALESRRDVQYQPLDRPRPLTGTAQPLTEIPEGSDTESSRSTPREASDTDPEE
jgi:hypothetical protein